MTLAFVAQYGALIVEGVQAGAPPLFPPLFALAATKELHDVSVLDGRETLALPPAKSEPPVDGDGQCTFVR